MLSTTHTDKLTGITWRMSDTIAARLAAIDSLIAAREAGNAEQAEQAQAQYRYAAGMAGKCQAQVLASDEVTAHAAHASHAADWRSHLRHEVSGRRRRQARQALTLSTSRKALTRRERLMPDERLTLRLLIDCVSRERLTPRDRARLASSEAARQADQTACEMNALLRLTHPEPWKGVTSVSEARHSERGASGIPGVQGIAATVTSRDHYLPAELIRHRDTVGHAPHHLLTAEQGDALMMALRHDRKLSTYRALQWRHLGHLAVLVDEGVREAHIPVMDGRRDGAREARSSLTARQAADRSAMALIGADLAALAQ